MGLMYTQSRSSVQAVAICFSSGVCDYSPSLSPDWQRSGDFFMGSWARFGLQHGAVESQKNLRVDILECWLNTQHGWGLIGGFEPLWQGFYPLSPRLVEVITPSSDQPNRTLLALSSILMRIGCWWLVLISSVWRFPTTLKGIGPRMGNGLIVRIPCTSACAFTNTCSIPPVNRWTRVLWNFLKNLWG